MGVENLKCELKQWKSLCDMTQESKPRTLTVQIAVDCLIFTHTQVKFALGREGCIKSCWSLRTSKQMTWKCKSIE